MKWRETLISLNPDECSRSLARSLASRSDVAPAELSAGSPAEPNEAAEESSEGFAAGLEGGSGQRVCRWRGWMRGASATKWICCT